jgi:hypothetical protein
MTVWIRVTVYSKIRERLCYISAFLFKICKNYLNAKNIRKSVVTKSVSTGLTKSLHIYRFNDLHVLNPCIFFQSWPILWTTYIKDLQKWFTKLSWPCRLGPIFWQLHIWHGRGGDEPLYIFYNQGQVHQELKKIINFVFQMWIDKTFFWIFIVPVMPK